MPTDEPNDSPPRCTDITTLPRPGTSRSADLAQAQAWCAALQLSGAKAEIAARILREISARLGFLNDVGLSYLSLGRSADSLYYGDANAVSIGTRVDF